MASDDRQQIIAEFGDAVNMPRKELEDWLQTDESKSVGQGGGKSTGHRSGRRIVEILQKNKSDCNDGDLDHMKKVNAYVKRHLGQGPSGGVEHFRWRYSLVRDSCDLSGIPQLYSAFPHLVIEGLGTRSPICLEGVAMPRYYAASRIWTAENSPTTRLGA